jgi:peptidoglycan/LPS O-acetylase OafA/YrhL
MAHKLAGSPMPTTSHNRFDLLRLVLAFGVFAYHAVMLSAPVAFAAAEVWLSGLAELCIQGFFIVSGALVYGSWARARGVGDYAEKRARRLLPAYVVVLIVPVLVSLALTQDVTGAATYLGANLIFLNFLAPTLPGLFEGQRFTAVNGALWTLKIEVMFYVLLPLLAMGLRRMGGAAWLGIAALYIGGEAWRLALTHVWSGPHSAELARQLPGQMAFFASGMAVWLNWQRLRAAPLWPGLIGAGLLGLSFTHPWLEPLRAAGLAGVIVLAAFGAGPGSGQDDGRSAARFGDISYGLYITHFPVLQGLVMAGVFAARGQAAGLMLATALVLAASFALWHLVEKPMLRGRLRDHPHTKDTPA